LFIRLNTKDERIQVLATAILNAENQQKQKELGSPNSDSSSNNYLDQAFSSNNRSSIDTLLDYFCHLDEHIVDKKLPIEHRLLFEMRRDSNDDSKTTTTATQLFLLSLFIHQANWEKLFDCVEFLFKENISQRYFLVCY